MTRVHQREDPRQVRHAQKIDAGMGAVVVCVGRNQPSASRHGPPRIWVRVEDASLRQRIVSEIASGLDTVREANHALRLPSMLDALSARSVCGNSEKYRGALARVDITLRRPGAIRGVVHALDGAGCLGIQLVYTKTGPLPEALEEVVFEVLEERRGHKDKVPIILTRKKAPISVWRHVLAAMTLTK